MSHATLTTFADRASELQAEQNRLDADLETLLGEIGERMADRLVELFKQDDGESKDFNAWLSGRYTNQTTYSVYTMFNTDEELKALAAEVRRFGRDKIYLAARGVNRRLKELGYTMGVNNHLNDLLSL